MGKESRNRQTYKLALCPPFFCREHSKQWGKYQDRSQSFRTQRIEAYGEQLLKKLEQRLKTKGLNERRFREFRRLYLVYPQLKEPVTQYIASQIQIRQSLTAEFTEPIRRLTTAESDNGVWKLPIEHPQIETWMIPADRLFNRLSSTHLNTMSGIENPVKRAFYEMETIRGCWSVKELERQIASLYYERSGLSKNKEALSSLVQQPYYSPKMLSTLLLLWNF